MGGFVPVTPPSGMGSKVGSVLTGLGGLIAGGQANANQVFSALPASVANIGQGLLNFAWRILRALGKVWELLTNVWVRVLRPMLGRLVWLAGRIRRLIEHDLPRLIKWIDKIRQKVLEIYEKYTRPILVQIQRIRRLLLILRLFRIKWAEDLDKKLVWVQDQVMKPVRVILEHLALVEQWLNVIVSAEQLIQETIFGRSVYHYQDPIVRTTLSAFGRPMGLLEKAELYPRRAAVTAEQNRDHLRQYLLQGTGPIAAAVERPLAKLRRL